MQYICLLNIYIFIMNAMETALKKIQQQQQRRRRRIICYLFWRRVCVCVSMSSFNGGRA